MAWYVYGDESDVSIAGPFLTAEEATDRAIAIEAQHITTEVGWLSQPDVEDDLEHRRTVDQALDDDADAYLDR